MRKLTLFLSVLVMGFGVNACQSSDRVEAAREPDKPAVADGSTDRSTMTADDKDFVEYAAETHVGETNMAEQARQKSTNKDVREYADKVIRLHADALKQLSSSVGQNAMPQSNTGSLTGSLTGSMDTNLHTEFLAKLSGAQFDREFINLMIADHKDARDTFRGEMNNTQNQDLKAYLEKAVPLLESGLNDAQMLQGKLGAQSTN